MFDPSFQTGEHCEELLRYQCRSRAWKFGSMHVQGLLQSMWFYPAESDEFRKYVVQGKGPRW